MKRSSWPDFRSLAAKIALNASMISLASLGSVPALVNRLSRVSPRPTVSVLVSAPASSSSKSVVVVVGRVVGRFVNHGGVGRGGKAEPVFGMIGRLDELPVAVADRAGLVGGLGIGEILGRFGHQPADIFGPELDAVRLRQDPARHVDRR